MSSLPPSLLVSLTGLLELPGSVITVQPSTIGTCIFPPFPLTPVSFPVMPSPTPSHLSWLSSSEFLQHLQTYLFYKVFPIVDAITFTKVGTERQEQILRRGFAAESGI